MMPYFSAFALEIKLAVFSTLGAWYVLADISSDLKGWEDITFKAFLMGLLYFIGREYLKQQREHKDEMKTTWQLHKDEMRNMAAAHKQETETREEEMRAAIKTHSESVAVLVGLTKEQTDYFKAVTRGLWEEKMKIKNKQGD